MDYMGEDFIRGNAHANKNREESGIDAQGVNSDVSLTPNERGKSRRKVDTTQMPSGLNMFWRPSVGP